MDTLCRVRDIYRSILEYETHFEQQHGLCLNEGILLCSLDKTGKLTSGEIAAMMGLTTSNASKVIRSVEKKSLIRRLVGQNDKRQMYFLLTSQGKGKLDQINRMEIEIPGLLQYAISCPAY